jgi:hypothetical protein
MALFVKSQVNPILFDVVAFRWKPSDLMPKRWKYSTAQQKRKSGADVWNQGHNENLNNRRRNWAMLESSRALCTEIPN